MACVAVIEDESDILLFLRDVLTERGYQLFVMWHYSMIRDYLAEMRPDIFLINVMLQGMSGIEIAHDSRGGGFSDTPMIAVSASPSMVVAAARSGVFQDVLAKPFDVDALVDMIEHRLHGRIATDHVGDPPLP